MTKRLSIGSATDIAKKWVDVTPGRVAYYAAAVKDAGPAWETNALNAGNNYKTAISAVDIAKRFIGGIKKAGASKYSRKAVELGVPRFPTGVAAAEDDFNVGFSPYRDVLDGLEVPDRKPRGDLSNYKIGEKIGDALFKKRIAMLGAGVGTK